MIVHASALLDSGAILVVAADITMVACISTSAAAIEKVDYSMSCEISVDVNTGVSAGVSAVAGMAADMGARLGAATNTSTASSTGISAIVNGYIRKSLRADVSVDKSAAMTASLNNGLAVDHHDSLLTAVRAAINMDVIAGVSSNTYAMFSTSFKTAVSVGVGAGAFVREEASVIFSKTSPTNGAMCVSTGESKERRGDE